MLTADARCFCERCERRTGNIYRMVGSCYNCHQQDILILYRSGDEARPVDCPTCGGWRKVHAERLATPDEIPAA